jgi:aminoglycoside 3-N-acetyltransferase
MEGPPAVAQDRLVADLRSLGLRAGGVAMVHTRMSALGWVIGGSETVVRALLEALGPDGTLMAYASWDEHVYRPTDWPAEHRAAYLAAPPVFDPATGAAFAENGRIPERIRTWPGARRSTQPDASVVAVGARADRLVAPHPDDDAYGADTPFARLVEAGGQVLMLGAPLDTITLLHHAEAIARVPGKRRVTFTVPVARRDGTVEVRTYNDIDTDRGPYPYEQLGLGDEPFAVIAREALAAGIGTCGRVGQADCHLFEARELTEFAVSWIEERFGATRRAP